MACALGSFLGLSALAGLAQQVQPNFIGFPGMSFSNLPGQTGDSYLGSTEGSFTLAPTAGSWFQSTIYGSPAPSIYDGPTGNPGVGVLLLTAAGNRFTFGSLDFSSNNGDSTYDIQGYLGANLIFDQTGTMPGTSTPVSFSTLPSSNPSAQVDALLIELIPIIVAGPVHITSINLDNINVTIVPEPGAISLLCVAFAAAFAIRRSIPSAR